MQAFLTLLLLAVAALWWAAPAPVPDSLPVPSPAPATVDGAALWSASAPSGLLFALPGELLRNFQAAFPLWARIASLLAALFAGVAIGRISVRTNLYGVNTCLPISLFGILACCLAGTQLSLQRLVAALLLARSLKRYCESFRDGYSFDHLFRASLPLGVLVLVLPSALPLLLLLPFGAVLFQRTRRETVVALAGMLLAPLLFCYLHWSLGGEFTTPAIALWHEFADGTVACLFRGGFAPWMAAGGVVVVLDLLGIGSVWLNLYSVGARARYLLLFNIGAVLLCLGMLCGPGAAPQDLLLLAVPSAVLLPFFFVRIHETLSSLLYLLLLLAAIMLLFVPVR